MRPSSIVVPWLAVVIGISAVVTGAAADELDPARRRPDAAADTGAAVRRVIVKFRTEGETGRVQAQAASDRAQALASRAGLALQRSRRLGTDLQVLEIESLVLGESLNDQLARLRADSAVEYADPDRRRYLHAAPNDPLYAAQWYLQSRIDAPSAADAEQAWDTTTGSAGVVIAVIDTGVLFDHPDLRRAVDGGRLLPGYDFVTDAAAANDGDGRDADPADPGDWVSAADVSSPPFNGCTESDSSWHGTRVAGIIGARTDNAEGIAGTTWRPWILPARALGKCGGYDSDILAAMLWAGGVSITGVPDNPFPARIENLSLGSSGGCTASYRDVIDELAARRVLVVVSAGNEGGPVDSPANCPGVAGVAGLRHAGTKVGYSSLGPEISISAPAGNCVNLTGACLYSIDTTFNLGTTTPGSHGYTDQFNYNVGTSFSAPIAAAITALMVSVNGNLRAAQLIDRLQEGATTPFPTDPTVPQCHVPTGPSDVQGLECNCTTDTCGAGMANALGAVNAALRPIAAVATPASVSAGQDVSLSALGSDVACGRTISTYAWEIVGATGSGISNPEPAVAVVVAPTSGSYTVRLTVTDDVGRQDTADVIVSASAATTTAPADAGSTACSADIAAGGPVDVSISPVSASVQAAGGTQAFTATLTNTTSTTVVWQVNGVAGGNATVGTIAASGVYSAPAAVPVPTTVTVTAAWSLDTSRSGSALVTVTAPPAPSGGGGGGGAAFDLLLVIAALTAAARVRRAPQHVPVRPARHSS